MQKRPDIPFLLDVLENCSAERATRLSVAFGHISRYFVFLHYIVERYQAVSRDYVENMKTINEMFQRGVSGDSFTKEEAAILDQGTVLHDRLHLEIESFYLFAKIFLDKVAHFLEFYFGQDRGRSLDSHDQLVKNIASYSESKGLALPTEFLELAETLKRAISDHRDYQIAHEKSPRTMYGTLYDLDGKTRITQVRLNPTDRDQQVESTPLEELLAAAERYLRIAIEIVKNDQRRSTV
jgi:hypothetical protein